MMTIKINLIIIIKIKNMLIQFKSFMFNKIMSNVSMITLKKANMMACILLCAFTMQNFNAQAQEEELTPVEILGQTVEAQGNVLSKLSKLKVSGYIQAQYQNAGIDADGTNFKLTNRSNAYDLLENQSYGRFGLRRGRIKFTYEDGLVQGVFQPDFTEKGIAAEGNRNVVVFKDAYLSVKDPWFGTMAVKAGIFDRPFGHEISYSSSTRESPERSRIFQTLFPDERDVGAMVTLQAPKTSPYNFLKLEGGMFVGSGIKPQFDNHFDFIGHLSATKTFDNISIGGGVSAYIGGQLMYDGWEAATDSTPGRIKPVPLYEMKDNKWEVKEADNYGKLAQRQYIGIDFQCSMFNEGIGFTAIRGEFITGTNPGSSSSITLNPTALLTGARYLRNISGGYIIFTQDIPTLPFTLVAKYDWYNPNADISGNDIGASGSSTGTQDIALNNIGVGLIWYINANLRLTAYYDIVGHETTTEIKSGDAINPATGLIVHGWDKQRDMNVFTLRLQYKF